MLEVNLSSFFGSSGKGLIKPVKILEKLESSFWKVQTASGTIKVFSNEKLEPGKTVYALIRSENNILKLETVNQENRSGAPGFFYSDTVNQTDILLKTAAGLNIKISENDLYLLKKILKKKKNGKFMVPVLLDAMGKGFKTEIQLEALSSSFDGKREHGGSREKLKKYLRKKITESDNSRNPLFLFNRIKNRNDHWIVIPFNISGQKSIDGAVRLRITGEKVANIAVDAVREGGADEWAFFIQPENSCYNMKIYCMEPEKLKESQSFAEFAKKLQNLRVKIDDNVRDIASYNGYNDKITDLDVMA